MEWIIKRRGTLLETIEDKFTHYLYGKFERIRNNTAVEFEDAVRAGFRRGSKKTWLIKSKNYVRWYPPGEQCAGLIALGTWGEIHALFDLADNELERNELHRLLTHKQ